MASTSSGVDWSGVQKSLLTSTIASLSSNDVIDLIKAISRSESDFLQPDPEYDTFFKTFAAVSAECISANIHVVCKTQIGLACKASRILLRYLLPRLLESHGGKEGPPGFTALSTKQLICPIKSLCTAKATLPTTDYVALVAVLAAAKFPTHWKKGATGEKEAVAVKDAKKPRINLTMTFVEQLTTPLFDFSLVKVPSTSSNEGSKAGESVPSVGDSVGTKEIEKIFIQTNIGTLQTLKGGEQLTALCLEAPHLSRYIQKYKEALVSGKFSLPTTHSEANNIRNNVQAVANDIHLVSCALSLPIYEPLDSARLEQLSVVTMSCLYCAVCVAAASSVLTASTAVSPKCSSSGIQTAKQAAQGDDESLDGLAAGLVEKTLEIYSAMSDMIRNSTRTGGDVLQNHRLLGVWVLLSGLQAQLSTSNFGGAEKVKEEKGKSPVKAREGSSGILMKVQQGCVVVGVLSVALASLCLQLMSELLDDLLVECAAQEGSQPVSPAQVSILGKNTALQRAARFLSVAPLNQLLFYLATITYRKACTLKWIQKAPVEGEGFNSTFSDSATYYEEDLMSCTGSSSEDDDEDSDRILGQWFEETLAPAEPPASQSSSASQADKHTGGAPSPRLGSLVPDKGEPHGYIILATQVFQFMNKHLLNNKSPYVWGYAKSGLSEQHMKMLAAIIRDLDRETARTEIGTISLYFGATLGGLYSEFSQALTRYTHNLLVCGILSEPLQATLLSHLGVNPWATDLSTWPLQVHPRTLAVLAQVLLLKQDPQEKERACINIWNRLVSELTYNACTPPATFETENEDLNVEHAQLVLFLFHSLNLMQKKSVLLTTASAVLRCVEAVRAPMKDSQILHLSRLLLLLDYLMRHLYDAPPTLLEQIQWNLFNATTMMVDGSDGKDGAKMPTRIYCPWRDIEDNYRKFAPSEEMSLKPRFYSLTLADHSNQDQPKLDGLACNFILGTPDKLNYPQLIDALIEILSVTDQCREGLSYTGLCAVQYCFTITWRFLLLLPPSTPFLEQLTKGEAMSPNAYLYSLVWGPRAGYKTFAVWMKDCLVRQGVLGQYAESLLRSVSKTVNCLSYDVTQADAAIQKFLLGPSTRDSPISLSKLCLLDAVIAKIQVLMDESISKPPDVPDPSKSSPPVESLTPDPELAEKLLPTVMTLACVLLGVCRDALLTETGVTDPLLNHVLALGSRWNPKTGSLGVALMGLVPPAVKTVAEKWNSNTLSEFPWNTYANDMIPAESYILAVVQTHASSLSSHASFSRNPSLQHLLYSAVTFITEQISKCPDDTKLQQHAGDVLLFLTMDASSEYLHMVAQRSLDKILGDSESEAHQERVYKAVLITAHQIICAENESGSPINDTYAQECLKFIEGFLEKPAGRRALESVFTTGIRDLNKILLSAADPNHSRQFSTKVFKFFLKLLSTMERNPGDVNLENLCPLLTRLTTLPAETLQQWLRHVILGAPAVRTPSPPPTLSPATTPATTEPTASAPALATVAEPAATVTPDPKDDSVAPSVGAKATIASDSQSDVGAEQEDLQVHHELLQALTTYFTKDPSSEEVPLTLLKAMIPIANNMLYTQEGAGFHHLMAVMTQLAGSGRGHVYLVSAALEWLQILKQLLTGKEVLEKLELGVGPGKHKEMLEAACHLLSYVGEVVAALAPPLAGRASTPPWEGDSLLDQDPDFEENAPHDEEDSGAEDSDEDSLCNKLCTFTITAKEFMNQHWYHCHTCSMVDSVGVCTVCARVCHRGHDVTYAKYGNFFCDCGAKQDGTCQALSKRTPQSAVDPQPGPSSGANNPQANFGLEQMLQSSLRRRPSSPATFERSERLQKDRAKLAALAKQLEGSRDSLSAVLTNPSLVSLLVNLVKSLLPAVKASCDNLSPVGCHKRGQLEMKRLHVLEKKFEETDQLMLPTLGSQEGAFENVKMNYSGDQGSTIRQLVSAHMIRRVAMCCLSSPHGKRQHLAVSHEKGKITVLQLSALLKQADSSKRKLTLTRLASAPIPFTVISITGNPWNEDFLAVCGLKECHVVTFSSNGLVADHLVLHPQLEGGNFIIKAIWLPGSQTELALVTADFIKIYDLSKDAISPKYFFLVPAGKVRDCTFYCNESYDYHYILVMTSAGYICTQEMYEESLAIHGPFFVMDVLENFHPEVKEINGQVEGGGVSVYYSHALQLLFFSYASGKSFVAPLTYIDKGYKGLPAMFMINWGKKKEGNAAATPQPLCQWSEVPNHPGLVFSVMQNSNNPVILMIRPDTILVQEIKVVPAKAKIMDMVAIRHPSSNAEHRTTLILLCEDGSLRIYMASMQHTGFWLSSAVQAVSTTTPRQTRKRKTNASQNGKPSGMQSFPVDFFEHCQPMNDVEFGGNDLLQVYNAQQIKHRLNTTNMSVVSTKQTGFSVEVTNADASLVMTGVRVFFNGQEAQRTPAYIEMFGRSIHTTAARNRWFDFPLYREESLQADKKLTINFGSSPDPDNVIMVDSIKVYGKTKDAFGWPEESEDIANNLAPSSSTSNAVTNGTSTDTESVTSSPAPPTTLEKMVSGILEVLDGCFILVGNSATDESRAQQRTAALEVATSLMTLPTPASVQVQAKALLSALFSTKFAYHLYKDCALLKHAYSTLRDFKALTDAKDIDPEAFYRLVLTVRSVAVARPYNLTKFPDNLPPDPRLAVEDEAGASGGQGGAKVSKSQLISDLMAVLWQLVGVAPRSPARAPVCKPGVTHTEAVVQALVEIFHAFTLCDLDGTISEAAKRYTELLLSDSLQISFSAKQALIRVLRPRPKRRRVFIPSPPHCATPGTTEMESEKGPVSQPSQDSSEADPSHFEADAAEPIVVLPPEGAAAAAVGAAAANGNPLEAIIAAQGGFPPLIDIPPDADDETMVELAIALSLQDHDNIAELPILQGGLPALGLHVLAAQGQGAANQEAGHYSDTTASAAGSDDEGSTAATDGSTLRTSPAEQAQGGSESGGSGVESITGEQNVSGRSSAYGDSQEPGGSGVRSDVTTFAPLEAEAETESWSSLHELRLTVLQHLVERAPTLRTHDGVHVIPFMQVLLMLTADLDGEEEKDKSVVEALLRGLDVKETVEVATRTPKQEVHLVIMRLLSVLMSRSKATINSNFVSQTTADFLLQSGVIKYCHSLLEDLLKYWKSTGSEESGNGSASAGGSGAGGTGGALLKPHLTASPPDMSPFFLMQYVKGHANDVFEAYPQLLTEMALRLPYQIQKHVDAVSPIADNFDNSWYAILCEYMMTQQTPFVRRQVRKLLLFLCGHKEKYRHLRDVHGLESHMRAVEASCMESGYIPGDLTSHIALNYDGLVELIEHLKACVEVAIYRTGNWQSFCLKRESTLATLLELSTLLDDGVAQTILQLLQCALCCGKDADPPKADTERATQLVQQLNRLVSTELLTRFLRTFLLETNATNVRWQAHALVLALYQNSPPVEQEALLSLMWKLWPQLPAYGRKAAQFVDLLGYFSLKTSQAGKKEQLSEYTQQAVELVRKQNQLLSHHPNASLYASLAQYVELDGYYLESEPCLVCNSPEVPMATIKLSSIKIDSKFTTTTQFVKLVSSHTISKITLRIGDLKRTKMVRTINVNYNNRSVQAVVELKSKTTIWHKAKKVSLASGQTEVKMEFPLPIVACNLMIEYADLYENVQATSETLQCPRCSASVPANPGVCGNCGENVFQCHKCRAINYDEKDPFLCHSCGFCKYAKFDYTLTARPCCAVDPIENDEDRNKTVAAINTGLEKADRVYRSLISNKPGLELLILRISEHRQEKNVEGSSGSSSGSASASSAGSSGFAQVNKAIQLLAQRYCGECKNAFDDLSKLIQRVVACRRELVAYDRNQRERGKSPRGPSLMTTSMSSLALCPGTDPAPGRCYGCASAAADHCLTLLRALATSPPSRMLLCQEGLIEELVKNNLRKNPTQIQDLLCLLTRDNVKATQSLCMLLMERITLTLKGHVSNSDLAYAVRHEMALLAALVQKEDTCWEQKLRCVMQLLFTASRNAQSPVVLESVTLPCLKILHGVMKPSQPVSKKNKDKPIDAMASIRPLQGVRVDARCWLCGDARNTFAAWRRRMPGKAPAYGSEEARSVYLSEKYGTRWRQRMLKDVAPMILSNDAPWLKQVLFNPSSRLSRQVACNMLESLCQVSVRKREILDLLTSYLCELGQAGESAAEFLSLYQNLLQPPPWKQYLAVKGLLLQIADFLTKEIQELHRLEETSLTSDLAQGYALKMLTELLASFLDLESIKQMYKGRLVGAVLNGYLSLRRLVVQRTRLIDDTQDKLLELLEEMTSGTEEETKAFMAICIETVKSQDAEDIRTPVFIFERLCSIIYPEESDTGEFFLTLDKDPQQEDFLQGRMLGNPYSSNEPGLGPLMRDVKNKICQDCELVALLEDDNGMELLVNNKIISLNLPVREVYKRVWLGEGGDSETMRVVYRMRGLLGDATEEFVETLSAKTESEVNNEEVYKMANVMAECGGLQVMLSRLAGITDLTRARPLLQVLLKLFRLCVKVKRNQEVLTQPELNAIAVFLNVLKELCASKESNASQAAITEQLLHIMEIILSKATSESVEKFYKFSETFGDVEHISALLRFTTAGNNFSPSVLRHLMRVLATLTYGNESRMAPLIAHFAPVIDLNAFDAEHGPEDEAKLELFCVLTSAIERNAIGNTLKDHIVSLGIVNRALEYITTNAASLQTTLSRTDSDEWKEFVSKPSLKYILRFLTGLAMDHERTQLAVAATSIPVIHRLEQVSSDEHVGSLAENLLEALKSNPSVATLIEEVREQTRAEKKRLAMAMRERQLGALGMRTNDKGQVTASHSIMQQVEDLGEETGHVCVICREGYKFQPCKVLGIYTFTKRCNVEEYEAKSRKTLGYFTVTHFNVVHVDCHMAAVRLARARDEWESAALQNANTKCNGLLPLWGPHVPESAFASCLARHNTYLQECTGHRDISYSSMVHDLKLLLLRFAQERSFHDDTGGGGPQSNMYIVPYLLHMALYVINTTRSGPREEKNLMSFVDCWATDKWIENAYEAEGPLYMAALSLSLVSPARWLELRVTFLRRLLVMAHARHVAPSAPSGPSPRLPDLTVKDYSVYKGALIYFALIDGIYSNFFKKVTVTSEEQWPSQLADYIRHNDEALMKAADRLLATYRDELLPCASFDEFCDVAGLLDSLLRPEAFLSQALSSLG